MITTMKKFSLILALVFVALVSQAQVMGWEAQLHLWNASHGSGFDD